MAKLQPVTPPPGLDVFLNLVGFFQDPTRLARAAEVLQTRLDEINGKIERFNTLDDASKVMSIAEQKLAEAERRLAELADLEKAAEVRIERQQLLMRQRDDEQNRAWGQKWEELEAQNRSLKAREAATAEAEGSMAKVRQEAEDYRAKAEKMHLEAEARLAKIKAAAQSLG